MKNITLFLFLFNTIIFFGQDTSKSSSQKVKKIIFDYKTKSFQNDEIADNLKISDWVQFIIINLDEDLIAEANIVYTDRNLELKNSFGGYLTFNANNEYIAPKKNDNEDSPRKKNDDNDKELDEKLEKETTKEKVISENVSMINSNYPERKVDINTMVKDLEINIAKKYLAKISKTDANAEKALNDINYQEYLIKILNDNITAKIKFKDDLINDSSNELAVLKSKLGIINNLKTIYFPPTKIENYDFTAFMIFVKNKEKNIITDNFNIPFSNYKGFKLDFSTGFIFNGLQTHNYKILALDNDNVVIKQEENGFSFNTGIALLVHAYARARKGVNYGITTGLSFNLNNQNLNYVLGGSILLGKDQRFIVSCGATGGRVKELVITSKDLQITSQVIVIDRL